MSRRIKEDYTLLSNFLSNYSLKQIPFDIDQESEAKEMHRRLLGIMIFAVEAESQNTPTIFNQFLRETVSDLMLSFFLWIQGLYKSAELELRCSIENFVKSVVSINTESIIREKNLYTVFEIAKTDPYFLTAIPAQMFEKLRSEYSLLCGTVHSDPTAIKSTKALNDFPKYNKSKAQEFKKMYSNVTEEFMTVLYYNFPQIVDRMHPENKEDFLSALSFSTKKNITQSLFDI